MTFEKFEELSNTGNLIPVYEIMTADQLTPVLAYLKLRAKNRASFLFESVEGGLSMARYSFIGRDPELLVMNRGRKLSIYKEGNITEAEGDIFEFIRGGLKHYRQARVPELPDFAGGMAGFIGYENVSLIEPSVPRAGNGFAGYDSMLGIYKSVVAFDHYRHQIILIANVKTDEAKSLTEAYQSARETLQQLRRDLHKNISYSSDFRYERDISDSMSDGRFHELVSKSKDHIIEGDIFQIVLSKRFSTQFTGDPFNVYRSLRIINPSPYMYFLEFPDDFSIMGTSPEDLVKVKNGKAQLLPIAGTRRRGRTAEEDAELERNLLADEKERAEHIMLVDLGRNDLGRVCRYGSVRVTELMKTHYYSHVMHLVSKVEGELKEDLDVIDALRACFPAGTVSGAPKIKAMQLISGFENLERSVYAGAAGYFDFSGNMDMCIAIRTLFAKGNTVYWQAGAGIVADSRPELESKEINNKAAVLVKALQFAEEIDENTGN